MTTGEDLDALERLEPFVASRNVPGMMIKTWPGDPGGYVLKRDVLAAAPSLIADAREVERLRAALKDAVRIMAGGHKGYAGDHWLYTVQVNDRTIDRLRAALEPEVAKP